ncbi:MAG: SRPBCC family protein [Acidimicrobiia bacterium]
MEINQQFEVARPAPTVWEFFQDVPAVATCLPGAELLDEQGDGNYEGRVTVKLGPMTATFEGACLVMPDPEAWTGRLEGKGVDKRGGSRGNVKVDYRVTETDGGHTSVAIDADVTLAGAIAQFGRTGLVNEISSRLMVEFVDCLEAKLAAPTPEAAAEVRAGEVKGVSLFFASLWSWIKGLFKRS